MVKVKGIEWKRFYAEAWPEGVWHECEEITIDGIEPPDDFDLSAVDDGAQITLAGGIVHLDFDGTIEGPSLETYFKRWRKRQTTTVIVVEVPHESAEAVRAAIVAAGGKVRA